MFFPLKSLPTLPLIRFARPLMAVVALTAVAQAIIVTGSVLLTGDALSLSSWLVLVGRRAVSVDAFWSLATVAAFLFGELAITGWQRSSLRKLVGPDACSRDDLAFGWMSVLGLYPALATICTLGLLDLVVGYLGAAPFHGPLCDAPAWIGAPLLYLGMTFCNYWGHRLMHTPFLWPLHAIHHAAPTFTMLTGARVSVVEIAQIIVTQAIATAALGGTPETLYGAAFIGGLETMWTHSNVRGVEWLERIGITSPKAHTLHHARDPQFHDRNFGDLVCLWDKLFGTFTPSSVIAGELELGIDDPEGIYVSGNALRDCFRPQWIWLTRVLVARPARSNVPA